MQHPPGPAVAAAAIALLLLTGGYAVSKKEVPMPVPDFASMQPHAKKLAFFAYLRPFVADANERIRADRRFLQTLSGRHSLHQLGLLQRVRLRAIAHRYDVDLADPLTGPLAKLQMRVDVVPEALALAQGAKESGWGTSRFARVANNWFGHYCYDRSCGELPQRRLESKRHELSVYPSIQAAVDAYMHNLNTHYRYQPFREIRDKLRRQGEPLSGTRLAGGLIAYSERREQYVREVVAMIKHNRLE